MRLNGVSFHPRSPGPPPLIGISSRRTARAKQNQGARARDSLHTTAILAHDDVVPSEPDIDDAVPDRYPIGEYSLQSAAELKI